jgi:hypothetical protein
MVFPYINNTDLFHPKTIADLILISSCVLQGYDSKKLPVYLYSLEGKFVVTKDSEILKEQRKDYNISEEKDAVEIFWRWVNQ